MYKKGFLCIIYLTITTVMQAQFFGVELEILMLPDWYVV